MIDLTREGACDHPASKAEFERFRAEFRADMERLRANLARSLRRFCIAAIGASSAIAAAAAFIKLTG